MAGLLQRTFAVGLTIPDNAAFTALETLRRMGLSIGGVKRADIWIFDVRDAASGTLAETIAGIETVFNPNKHELVERPGSHPVAGEVWIAAQDEAASPSVGGRVIPGVSGIRRCVGWQLFDASGSVAGPALLQLAVETFLCNPAFQKAIR